jgi:hypothetical protein
MLTPACLAPSHAPTATTCPPARATAHDPAHRFRRATAQSAASLTSNTMRDRAGRFKAQRAQSHGSSTTQNVSAYTLCALHSRARVWHPARRARASCHVLSFSYSFLLLPCSLASSHKATAILRTRQRRQLRSAHGSTSVRSRRFPRARAPTVASLCRATCYLLTHSIDAPGTGTGFIGGSHATTGGGNSTAAPAAGAQTFGNARLHWPA